MTITQLRYLVELAESANANSSGPKVKCYAASTDQWNPPIRGAT